MELKKHDNKRELVISGYPGGSSVHGVSGPDADELRRLTVFSSDLRRAQAWLGHARKPATSRIEDISEVDEALYEMSLIVLCRCFEDTTGLRAKPLSAKRIFSPQQRTKLKCLKTIRDKIVAHDEQLFGGTFSLVVRGPNDTAIDAICISGAITFLGMVEADHLPELVNAAIQWLTTEMQTLRQKIQSNFNALPHSSRVSPPPFTITIREKEYL